MSYFGKINPYPLGLLSGLNVAAISYAITLVVGRISRYSLAITILISWLVYCALIISNWWYFQYFQSWYNHEVLALGGDLIEGANAYSGLSYKPEALVLALATFICGIFAILTYQKKAYNSETGNTLLIGCLVIASVSFWFVNSAINRYKEAVIPWLLPSHLHPAQAFFYSDRVMRDILPDEIQSFQYFKHANTRQSDKPASLYNFKALNKKKNYNVIMIMLESVRASMLGHYGSDEQLTPQLDRLAKQFISAKHFYANTNYTVKGETAAWCGIFDHNIKAPISKYSEQISNLTCLPQLLKDQGYRTLYFHGYHSNFYNRKAFLPLVGFDYQYFHKDIVTDLNQSETIGWGIADEQMYDIMLQKLNTVDQQPFFSHITTLSSHYPFSWDWNIDTPFKTFTTVTNDTQMYNNYKNAIYYQDYALGQFWHAFANSALAENTIVLITSDHGVWTFDDSDNTDLLHKNEFFFRAPLIIYHPDIQQPIEITTVSSQIDLPVTVMDMLGIKHMHTDFVGKSIFDKVAKPWAVMMKSGQIISRSENQICYMQNTFCSGIHQNCVSRFDPALFWQSELNSMRCVEITGDLLNHGIAKDINAASNPLKTAQKLINYHNKTIVSPEKESPLDRLANL